MREAAGPGRPLLWIESVSRQIDRVQVQGALVAGKDQGPGAVELGHLLNTLDVLEVFRLQAREALDGGSNAFNLVNALPWGSSSCRVRCWPGGRTPCRPSCRRSCPAADCHCPVRQ